MKKHQSYEYSHKGVYQSLIRQAHAIKMPEGIARVIAEEVAAKTDKWIEDKEMVTEDDLKKVICDTLDKLSPDLAYAYRNNDKVI